MEAKAAEAGEEAGDNAWAEGGAERSESLVSDESSMSCEVSELTFSSYFTECASFMSSKIYLHSKAIILFVIYEGTSKFILFIWELNLKDANMNEMIKYKIYSN